MPKSFPGGKITNPFTEVASKDLMVFELRRQMRKCYVHTLKKNLSMVAIDESAEKAH